MDGGHSWIILFGSFLNLTLIGGTIRTFGILYAELLDVYTLGSGNTVFIQSVMVFTASVVGPFAGLISTSYSFKWCTLIGGLLAGLGMAVSSFTTKMETLFFTYSIMIGTGLGMSVCPTITIVMFYFNKKRAFANAILWSANGLSTMIYPVLYRRLIDTFGIQGAMLILGGILFNICVGACLFRQPSCFRQRHDVFKSTQESVLLQTSDQKSVAPNFRQKVMLLITSYRNVFKNRSFQIYCISCSFAMLGYTSNFTILPPHVESQHFTKSDAMIVITVIGGTELVTRFISGKLLDMKYFTAQTLFIVNMFIGGIFSIILPFFREMAINIIYAVMVGVFPGVLQSVIPLLLVSILGVSNLPSILPLNMLISHTFMLIGMPILGWLEDWTGNWSLSFYTVGGLLIVSSICVFAERLIWNSNKKSEKEMNEQRQHKIRAGNGEVIHDESKK